MSTDEDDQEEQDMTNGQITVYGKPECPQCEMTAKKLDRDGAPYEYKDITQDNAAYQRVTETLGYRQAPVIETPSGNHFGGFNPAKLDDAVNESHMTSPGLSATPEVQRGPSAA